MAAAAVDNPKTLSSSDPRNRSEETDASENVVPDICSTKSPSPARLGTASPQTEKRAKSKHRTKQKRLVMNVSTTKYVVVKHVGKEALGYKLSRGEDQAWDLYWTDSYVTVDMVARMRGCQRINHFPGMEGLARKNLLSNNLNKMQRYLPDEYNFYPKTWLLPSDQMSLFLSYSKGEVRTMISKPEASCQGKGIFLTKTLDDYRENEHYVVQRYLEQPMLIEGLKFDMRIYALLAGCNPMKIYVYDKGIARFATVPFEKPAAANLDDHFMHLTNYAVNKRSSHYKCVGDGENSVTGHKRCLSFIWKYLDAKGFNSENIRKEINEIIIKTICAIQPIISHLLKASMTTEFTNKSCFEVLGFDIILDAEGKPWLLEVNHSPSFATETKFDWNLKRGLVEDTLQIVSISQREKTSFLWKQAISQKRRILGKPERVHVVKRIPPVKKIGGYTLVYPGEERAKYERHLRTAAKVWTEFTQGKKVAARIVIPGEKSSPARPRSPTRSDLNTKRSKSTLRIEGRNCAPSTLSAYLAKRPARASVLSKSCNHSAVVTRYKILPKDSPEPEAELSLTNFTMNPHPPASESPQPSPLPKRRNMFGVMAKPVTDFRPPSSSAGKRQGGFFARVRTMFRPQTSMGSQSMTLTHLLPMLDSDLDLIQIQQLKSNVSTAAQRPSSSKGAEAVSRHDSYATQPQWLRKHTLAYSSNNGFKGTMAKH